MNEEDMTVGEHIIRGLEQILEYLEGNHSVGRKVTYISKDDTANDISEMTENLTDKD